MNDHREPFSCATCGKRLPLKKLFTLSNFSKIKCEHCGVVNRPEMMGPWAFAVGFLSVAIAATISLRIKDSIALALSIGFIAGLVACLLVARYLYKRIKFHADD